MKKLTFLLSAVALLGLASCTEPVEINPNYNPETKEVTAQFVLNIANGKMPVTKQSAATVQRAENFRGLTNAKLFALKTGASASDAFVAPYQGQDLGTTGGQTTTDGDKIKVYDLGTLYAAGSITNTGEGEANTNYTSSSHRILELSLPLNTDAALFYAKAPASGTDAENGKMVMNINESAPQSTTFDLVTRLSSDNKTKLDQTEALAAIVLNRIISSQVAEVESWSHNTWSNSSTLTALSWMGLADQWAINNDLKTGTKASLTALEEILGEALYKFITINEGEYRAGSASAVQRMVADLYYSVMSVYNATATSDLELNAQRLASEIKARIESYFNASISSGTATATFRNVGTASETNSILNVLTDRHVITDASAYSQVTDLKTYPIEFNIPMGAALLSYSDMTINTSGIVTAGGFSYKTTNNSLLNGTTTFDPTHYMYPAELAYFCNSLLRVSDESKKEEDYPNGTNPWNTSFDSDWTIGKVLSSTRSVAVKNNINYGVAMLKTTVAYAEGVSELEDNRTKFYPTEDPNKKTVTNGLFELTGVLIGGQNHQLNWQYLAKTNAASDWNYIVYDNAIASKAVPTTANPNYTLVFDNYNTDGQEDVYVALEFKNLTDDFYGKDNVIRKDGTFYLVGKLVIAGKTVSDWDTYYPVPPYGTDGTSQKITRVFIQDFMTEANFVLNKDSLKSAIVTVPDLRSSQISLGLSVDLKWRSGLSFDVVLGAE